MADADDWLKAADAAQALLDEQGHGDRAVYDPALILENDTVFVVPYVPAPVNDTALMVEKDTLVARFEQVSPIDGLTQKGLRPVMAADEDPADVAFKIVEAD